MIEATQHNKSGWCVVEVSGAPTPKARTIWKREAVSSHPKVAADLSALGYISSAGLRALILAARAAQAGNVEFVICSPSAPVRQVFDISGLEQILTIRGELPC